MAASFLLRIVSPAAAVFSGEATLVEIPGAEGDFGVLAGHMNLLSLIKAGVIRVESDGQPEKRFFAGSGYADVSPEGTIILSDHIEDLAEMTPAAAQKSLEEAQGALAVAENDVERSAAQKRIDTAQALVTALNQ